MLNLKGRSSWVLWCFGMLAVFVAALGLAIAAMLVQKVFYPADYAAATARVAAEREKKAAKKAAQKAALKEAADDEAWKACASVTSISTRSGTISIGMTWDDALPLLGAREELNRITEDFFVDTREIGGASYQVAFQRTGGGAYRVSGMCRMP